MIRQLVKKTWSVGEKVKFYLARYDDIYTGEITAVHSNGTYDIEYVSGSTKVVRRGIKSKDIFPYKHGNTAQQVVSMQQDIAALRRDVAALTTKLEKQIKDNQRDHEASNAGLQALAQQLLAASKAIQTLSEKQADISGIKDRLTELENLIDEFDD
jgi:superfamily I DNA/RNA helicase